MGIYIPNKAKPKNCWVCFNDDCNHWGENGYDNSDDCPLIEIDLVRCGECKWWDSDDGNIGYCHAEKHCHFSSNWEISIYRTYKADHYCSDGERRADE